MKSVHQNSKRMVTEFHGTVCKKYIAEGLFRSLYQNKSITTIILNEY